MGSPIYDLGSLCSSPLLYTEGDDFLRQPVNVFYDEDISFDFVDSFGTGFAIAGNGINEVKTALRAHDQILTSDCATSARKDNAEVKYNKDKKTFNGGSSSDKQVIACNNENRGSVDDTTSASECTESNINEVTSIKTEHLQSVETLCKTDSEDVKPDNTSERQNENHAISQNDYKGVKYGGQADNSSSAIDSSRDQHKHFQDSACSNNNFDEKPIIHNAEQSSCGVCKPRGKNNQSQDLAGKDSLTTRGRKIDDSSFSVKSSPFKRCVVPKTFYSPFWTSESSTAKQEKFTEDGFIHAQRNVDMLYCCNCRSQKRDTKSRRYTTKSDAGFYKDCNKYTDFLKRNSVFKQQGNSGRHHNKTITEVVSVHLDDSGTNKNDKWISLPEIHTSLSKPKAAPNKKTVGAPFQPNTLSLTSIEGLIKKYKGHGYDLLEEQKRYQLKPFK